MVSQHPVPPSGGEAARGRAYGHLDDGQVLDLALIAWRESQTLGGTCGDEAFAAYTGYMLELGWRAIDHALACIAAAREPG